MPPYTRDISTATLLESGMSKFSERINLNYMLNGYRNWELLAPWQGSKITVPTKYISGDKDFGYVSGGGRDFVEGDIFKSLVPNLEVAILDGHHFIHQEKAQEVSDEILSFIHKLSLD